MKVLFIGGTGIISSACSQLALEQGIDLYLLNRGQSDRLSPPDANILLGDIRDPARQVIDEAFNQRIEKILAAYGRAWQDSA